MTKNNNNLSVLVQEIVQGLEGDIVSGGLRPGDRLDEQRLAARFGASRTPVREALHHLAAAELVELRPRKGAVVAEVPIPRMVQMFEVLSTLEGLCARLAARRMTAEERARLKVIHETCNEVAKPGRTDAERYFLLGSEFHEVVLAGAHNPFLAETVRNIRKRVSAYRRQQLEQPGRVAEWHEDHDHILKAILAGDADLANQMMRKHINLEGDVFVDLITTLATAEAVAGGGALTHRRGP